MRKTKEQKAITLIALIITIVVLLILAVVAINAVTGDGIIQHATNAKTEYEEAQDEEQDVLSYYEQYLETEGKTGDWIQNKSVIKNVKTGQVLEVGEYVNYESGVSTYKDENGKEKAWGILGVENGHILLVSVNDVTTKTLEGKLGYLNGITELNDLCEGYDDSTGAIKGSGRSIKVEDINRITGYNPLKTGTGDVYYNPIFGKVTQYLNEVTYTLSEEIDDSGNKHDIINFSSKLASGKSNLDSAYQTFEDLDGTILVKDYIGQTGTAKEITVIGNEYRYFPTTLTTEETGEVKGIKNTSKAYDVLFKDAEYWLASSFVIADTNSVAYGMRRVRGEKVIGAALWRSYGTSQNPSHGVRAVIALDSSVKLVKDGENTYNISQ